MPSENDHDARHPARFGRVDPYCWVAVGSVLVLAVVLVASDVPSVGIVLVVLAGLVALFDARVNRPKAVAGERVAVRPRSSRRSIADRVGQVNRPRRTVRPQPS